MTTNQPITIRVGNRVAVIEGKKVQLYRVRIKRKKEKLLSVWPEMTKPSRIVAWNTGLLWAMKCFIETGEGSMA